MFLKVCHVTKFSGPVDNHVHKVTSVGDDGVVHDSTFFVSDQTQETVTIIQTLNVTDDYSFKKFGSVGSVPTNLTHVRHVKQRSLSLGTAPQVLLHNSTVRSLLSFVEDGEFISRERYHVPAQIFMPLVKGCFAKRLIGGSSSCKGSSRNGCPIFVRSNGRCRGGRDRSSKGALQEAHSFATDFSIFVSGSGTSQILAWSFTFQ
mmetsp:Transcript_16907/g.38775  ORF Transcript_16907/g.38775 Transcript_16907/m.38775 type:complete len:204 (+) Transcript_16907:1223-1834(+)